MRDKQAVTGDWRRSLTEIWKMGFAGRRNFGVFTTRGLNAPNRIASSLFLTAILSALSLQHAHAVGVPGPRVWNTGTEINGGTASASKAVIEVGTGASVSVSGASDTDAWTKYYSISGGVADSGTAGDSITYSWSGSGTFTSPTSASTSWTAPNVAGTYTLTCTVDDLPTSVVPPETGSRNDSSKSRSVQIKVVNKVWTADTPVGQGKDGSGNPVYNGRMTAPQDQTASPATPANVIVAAGPVVSCAVETATDNDKWTMDLNDDGDTLDTGESGFGADTVSYAWTAGGGSFANATASSTNWTAPTTPGSYTVTCTLNDAPAAVTSPDTGTRDDASVARSVTVWVVDVASLEYRIDDPGAEDDGEAFTAYTDALQVPLGTVIVFKAIRNPSNAPGWPPSKPVWGGSSGASGTGETKSVTFNTASTTATDYKTVTAECGNTITANIAVFAVDLNFTGSARACAGGIDNDAHKFTLQFNAKKFNANLASVDIDFSFERNQSHDSNRKAKFLTSAQTWAETTTVTTDANGNASITVLSSDIVSQTVKIVAKYDDRDVDAVELNGDTVAGERVTCDFAAMEALRRFGLVKFPSEADTGWIFNGNALINESYSEEVIASSGTTPAKVYLKFRIDPAIARDTVLFNVDGTPRRPLDDDGNWKYVNGHSLRIQIADIIPQDGLDFSGTISDYATLLDANGDPVDYIDVTTANDGAAQVQVRAEMLVDEAKEIILSFDNLTQW